MRQMLTLYLVIALLTPGCAEEQITIYDLPKQHEHAGTAPTSLGPDGEYELVFTSPQGWKQVQPSSGMVRRQFMSNNVKITHSAFPGTVGGDLANINRWRGQVGLPPISAQDVGTAIVSRELGELVIRRVDLANNGRRMVIDMIRVGSMTWFIKIDGTSQSVMEQLTAFDQHVDSAELQAFEQDPSE